MTLEEETRGYSIYKNRIEGKSYPEQTLQAILNHRNEVLAKCVPEDTRAITNTFGMGYTKNLIIPTDYPGTFIDVEDVFAAVYCEDFGYGFFGNTKHTYIHWAFITNDIYMPVLPVIYLQKKSLFNKKKNDFIAVVEGLCKNLKYPVSTVDELEALIKKEQSLRGRMNKNFLLGQLYDAKNHIGLFEPLSISYEFGSLTTKILKENGYEIG